MKSLKPTSRDCSNLRPRDPESSGSCAIHIGLLLSLAAFASCQSPSSSELKPMAAAALAEEYARAKGNIRSRYDGKEIVIRGYVSTLAAMPQGPADQGALSIDAPAVGHSESGVTCWFSNDQQEEFAAIARGKYVTVKGVFNGEGGADLKFCRVIKIE